MRRSTSSRRLILSCAAATLLSAAPAAAAPSWLPAGDVSPSAMSASVAVDAHGTAIATGTRDDGTGNYTPIVVSRAAGGSWQPPLPLSTAHGSVSDPEVVVDAAGDAAAIWSWSDAGGWQTDVAVRPAATGAWQPAIDLCPSGQSCASPRLGVDGSGDAVAVWQRYNGSNYVIDAAVGSITGGAWTAPVQLSQAGSDAYAPQVALDKSGTATAIWYRYSGKNGIIQTSTRPLQSGSWQAPTSISAAALSGYFPQLGVDPAGDAVAVWQSDDGVTKTIVAATRAGAAGAWSTPVAISPAGHNSYDPVVWLDDTGHALAAWDTTPGAGRIVQAASLPQLSGPWSAPQTLSASGTYATGPLLAGDAAGDALAVWQVVNGPDTAMKGSARPVGGTWQAPTDLSPAGEDAASAAVASGADGNGIAVWTRVDLSGHTLRDAPYDGSGPALGAVSIPATGTAGTLVGFSAAPVDEWSPLGTTGWDFGDGQGATGTAVAHTYAAAGTYTVRLTSADALGNTAQTSGTITIVAAPTVRPVRRLPRITAVRISPARFRVARSLAAISPRARRGTILRYTLSTTATTSVAIRRSVAGLRSATGRCVAATQRLIAAHARGCSRILTLAVTTRRRERAGSHAIRFTGRVGGRPLAPGRYRVVLSAANSVGRSAPVGVAFAVIG